MTTSVVFCGYAPVQNINAQEYRSFPHSDGYHSSRNLCVCAVSPQLCVAQTSCSAPARATPCTMRPVALACVLLSSTTAAAQGFVEWRVTSVFERLLVTLGVSMQPGAFGSAFDAEKCNLEHEKIFRGYLQPGFDALLSDDDAVVRIGVRALAKGLRTFGRSCERCDLPLVLATLLP